MLALGDLAAGAAALNTSPTRGKVYPWVVWTALMALTGISTAFLLDVGAPLISRRRLALADPLALHHHRLAGTDVVAATIGEASCAGRGGAVIALIQFFNCAR